jgi:uncharacterized protein YggT (Ycf19 family)
LAVAVLFTLSLLKLVVEIALLALLGQGVLYVLAGQQRQTNFFYQLLQVLSKPFTAVVRKATPARVADQHVPIVTFFLLSIVWVVVVLEKVSLCGQIGVENCR